MIVTIETFHLCSLGLSRALTTNVDLTLLCKTKHFVFIQFMVYAPVQASLLVTDERDK